MLTCVSPKYFDRAIEIVQVLRNKSLKRHTRQPTLISLAYKYSFDESQIKQVRALQSAFTDGIGTDLRDDRVVCALFWVVCPYFGYVREENFVQEVAKKSPSHHFYRTQ